MPPTHLLLLIGYVLFWFLQVYNDVYYCVKKYIAYQNINAALKDPKKVCALDLSSNNLTQIPPDIYKFTNLKILYLKDNKIDVLPLDFTVKKISFS